jgi:hypothetical protein
VMWPCDGKFVMVIHSTVEKYVRELVVVSHKKQLRTVDKMHRPASQTPKGADDALMRSRMLHGTGVSGFRCPVERSVTKGVAEAEPCMVAMARKAIACHLQNVLLKESVTSTLLHPLKLPLTNLGVGKACG